MAPSKFEFARELKVISGGFAKILLILLVYGFDLLVEHLPGKPVDRHMHLLDPN